MTEVTFYDGFISKAQIARIKPLDQDTVLVEYGDEYEHRRQYKYKDMILIGELGNIKPIIELADDARLEFKDVLPDWFNLKSKKAYQSIWKLERSPSLILFSVVFVVGIVFATVKWGVPAVSNYLAFHLPENTLKKIGDEAQSYVEDMTKESELPIAKQDSFKKRYQEIIAEGRPANIIFRKGESIGANALAIPNNTIIVTDELVELAKNDDEVIGVLAHEQGHLVKRHSLQQSLSSLGFSVILIGISGDVSDLMTTLPTVLIGAKYSRSFESEADQYALNIMHKNKISPLHLANFLERLETSTSEEDEKENKKESEGKEENQNDSSVFDFLVNLVQSHPDTEQRVQAIKDFEAKHKAQK